MAKTIPDDTLDAMLALIADNGDEFHICVGQPDDYADITNHSIGNVTLTLGDGNGDYVLDDGDVSGRKLTITAQSVTPSDDGDIDHIVIADSINDVILAITTASFSVKDSLAKAIPEFDLIEIADPT